MGSDVADHALELAVPGSRYRVDQPDVQGDFVAEAVTRVGVQGPARVVAEARGRHHQHRQRIETVLPYLRFEYSHHALEEMVEATDRAPVGQPDRVIGPADDLIDQRKRPAAGATLLLGCRTHEVPAAVADQRHREVVEPGAYELEQAVSGGEHLDVRIIGQKVMAAFLAGADRRHSLELPVPVEHPAAEGALDLPPQWIRKGLRRGHDAAQRPPAVP